MLPKLLRLIALTSSPQIKVPQIIIISITKIDFPHYPWPQPINSKNQLLHPAHIILKRIPAVGTT